MKSPKQSQELKGCTQEELPNDGTHHLPDEETEADESEFDDSELPDADDDRWDVFVLDEDCEPLPEYGDFWFPD